MCQKQAQRWFEAGAETAEIGKPDLPHLGEEFRFRYVKLLSGASAPKRGQQIGVVEHQPRRGACPMSEQLLALTGLVYDAAGGATSWASVGKDLERLVNAQSASLM